MTRQWAVSRNSLQDASVLEPLTWVTDRELALINSLDPIFPSPDYLLCSLHVSINVFAIVRKYYPEDTSKPSRLLQGCVADPK